MAVDEVALVVVVVVLLVVAMVVGSSIPPRRYRFVPVEVCFFMWATMCNRFSVPIFE